MVYFFFLEVSCLLFVSLIYSIHLFLSTQNSRNNSSSSSPSSSFKPILFRLYDIGCVNMNCQLEDNIFVVFFYSFFFVVSCLLLFLIVPFVSQSVVSTAFLFCNKFVNILYINLSSCFWISYFIFCFSHSPYH